MTQRARLVAFAVVVVLAVAGVVGYVLVSRKEQPARTPTSIPTTQRAQVEAVPHLVFRSTTLGPDYGKVAMSTLADPGGPRALTPDAASGSTCGVGPPCAFGRDRVWCWAAR